MRQGKVLVHPPLRHKPSAMRNFRFDIYQWGRYKCTVTLKFPKDWQFSQKDILDGIETQRPCLKGQDYQIKCAE